MISAITNVGHPNPVSQSAVVNQKAPQSKPQTAPTDTAQLSNAAKAALQEVLETPAQTSKEANTGDLQAQRLLAREAAGRVTGK